MRPFVRCLLPGAVTQAEELVRQENLAVSEGLKRQDAGPAGPADRALSAPAAAVFDVLCGNREMAEDLFQEVWMRVLTRGGQFNGKARFETWLFTIARNMVIDQRRKRTRCRAWTRCLRRATMTTGQ